MRILIHGFENYYMSAKDFLETLFSGNLYGASLECEATIGNEKKTFSEWRKDLGVRDKVEKFDGHCFKCGCELLATAGGAWDCNTWTCEGCGDITPELGSLALGDD